MLRVLLVWSELEGDTAGFLKTSAIDNSGSDSSAIMMGAGAGVGVTVFLGVEKVLLGVLAGAEDDWGAEKGVEKSNPGDFASGEGVTGTVFLTVVFLALVVLLTVGMAGLVVALTTDLEDALLVLVALTLGVAPTATATGLLVGAMTAAPFM